MFDHLVEGDICAHAFDDYIKSSDANDRNCDSVLGEFAVAAETLSKGWDIHNSTLNRGNKLNRHANGAFFKFCSEGGVEPEAGEQVAGAFGVGGIDVEFDDLGGDFLLVIGDVELARGDKMKLDVFHFEVLAEVFRHGVAAGQGWMHSHEPSEGNGEVRVHAVEGNPIVVLGQPVEQFPVELEVVEGNVGFEGDEKDELFLGGDGLQVHDIFFNVGFGNLGDVFDLIDGGTQGVVGLEAGHGIKQEGSLKEHFHKRNRVDFVVGGKR